jgi:hypothetical protein
MSKLIIFIVIALSIFVYLRFITQKLDSATKPFKLKSHNIRYCWNRIVHISIMIFIERGNIFKLIFIWNLKYPWKQGIIKLLTHLLLQNLLGNIEILFTESTHSILGTNKSILKAIALYLCAILKTTWMNKNNKDNHLD